MSLTTPAWVGGVTAPNPGPMTLQGTNTWIFGSIEHVLLTHGHGDHSDGALRCARFAARGSVVKRAGAFDVCVGGLSAATVEFVNIQDSDTARFEQDPASACEVCESFVYRFAGCADQLCKFFLS
jgi:phosphoribosyl 1,2-cyclic phosphodiesterase